METQTNIAVTYIAGSASTLRIATRWQLQKRGYYCGTVRPGFASCTEWQLCRELELGAPSLEIANAHRKKKEVSLSIHILIRSGY